LRRVPKDLQQQPYVTVYQNPAAKKIIDDALSASVDVEWFACIKRFLILHLNETPAPPTVLPPQKDAPLRTNAKRGTQTLMSQRTHNARSMNPNPSRPPPQRSAQATHCSIGAMLFRESRNSIAPMLHIRGMPNTTNAEH